MDGKPVFTVIIGRTTLCQHKVEGHMTSQLISNKKHTLVILSVTE